MAAAGPGWTVLPESEALSSGTPSEDELLLGSQDMQDELEPTPPTPPTPPAPPNKKRKQDAFASGDNTAATTGLSKKVRVDRDVGEHDVAKGNSAPIHALASPSTAVLRPSLEMPFSQIQIARKRTKQKKRRLIVDRIDAIDLVAGPSKFAATQPSTRKGAELLRLPSATQRSLGGREGGRVDSLKRKRTGTGLSDEDELESWPTPAASQPALTSSSQHSVGSTPSQKDASLQLSDDPKLPFARHSTSHSKPDQSKASSDRPRLDSSASSATIKSNRELGGSGRRISLLQSNPEPNVFSSKKPTTATNRSSMSSSSSSDELPVSIGTILDDYERSHPSSSPSTPKASQRKSKVSGMSHSGGHGQTRRGQLRNMTARKSAAQQVPSRPKVGRERRKSAYADQDVIELSDEPVSASQRPTLTPRKRMRRSSPFNPPVDVITISDSGDEGPPKPTQKRPDVKFREDADGVIVLSDGEDDGAAPNVAPAKEVQGKSLDSDQPGDWQPELPSIGLNVMTNKQTKDIPVTLEAPVPVEDVGDKSNSADEHDVLGPQTLSSLTSASDAIFQSLAIEDRMQELDLGNDLGVGPQEVSEPELDTCGGNDSLPDHPAEGEILHNEDAELATSIGSQLRINSDASSPSRSDSLDMQPTPLSRSEQLEEEIHLSSSPNLCTPLNSTDLHRSDHGDDRMEVNIPVSDKLRGQRRSEKKSSIKEETASVVISKLAPAFKSKSSSVRISGALYGGPNGFFKNIFKIKAKSRPTSQKVSTDERASLPLKPASPVQDSPQPTTFIPSLGAAQRVAQSGISSLQLPRRHSAASGLLSTFTAPISTPMLRKETTGVFQDEPHSHDEAERCSASTAVNPSETDSSSASDPMESNKNRLTPQIQESLPLEGAPRVEERSLRSMTPVTHSEQCNQSRLNAALPLVKQEGGVTSMSSLRSRTMTRAPLTRGPSGLSLTEVLNNVYYAHARRSRSLANRQEVIDLTSESTDDDQPLPVRTGSVQSSPIVADYRTAISTSTFEVHPSDRSASMHPPQLSSCEQQRSPDKILSAHSPSPNQRSNGLSAPPDNAIPTESNKSPRSETVTEKSLSLPRSSPFPKPSRASVPQDPTCNVVRYPSSTVQGSFINTEVPLVLAATSPTVYDESSPSINHRRQILGRNEFLSPNAIATSGESERTVVPDYGHMLEEVSEVSKCDMSNDGLQLATHSIIAGDNPPAEAIGQQGQPISLGEPQAQVEDEEEEECLDLLAYPDTSDVDMSDGHSSIAFSRKRPFRSHASSETSVVSVRPLRSSRRSSTSASSSSIGPAEVFSPFDPSFVEPRIHVPRGRSCASEDIASTLDEVAHRNGFEMLTWEKDRVRIAKEFANTCKLAKDIPHELQDRINALHLTARRADNVQVKLFEAAISENTADDEPFAPQIYVINDVDDELTPPYEFHYSNLMWHGKGVPRPDTENLKGCNCHGPCDPNSRTCSCVKRQQQLVVDSGISGFIYDNKGRLRHHDYPIFECNDMCGCSDDCKNRVVQHGRKYAINIQKTAKKGWGVFAGSRKIPANTFIGIYAGEYITDAEGEERGSKYNKFGRTYLFDLDFHYLRMDNPDWETKYCVDAYHVGNFTRYLNHSCDPNCNINACYVNEANLDKPLLTIFTLRDVAPEEELCFSYFGNVDDDDGDADDDYEAESRNFNDAVHVPCQCGTARCKGKMWK
ncbi:hypothetical protein AcV7_004427 [Taiwanofungus camphoratus]|nr:hypothetical protein AcV7_004427 [Antrodia cinnamomea]